MPYLFRFVGSNLYTLNLYRGPLHIFPTLFGEDVLQVFIRKLFPQVTNRLTLKTPFAIK